MTWTPGVPLSIRDLLLAERNVPERVRLMGVVSSFETSENGDKQLLLDDGTSHIIIQASGQNLNLIRTLREIEQWVFVEIVGTVVSKTQTGGLKVFIQAELGRKITDHNWLLFNRALRLTTPRIKTETYSSATQQETHTTDIDIITAPQRPGKKKRELPLLGSSLTDAIYNVIADSQDEGGISLTEIMNQVQASEEEVSEAIIDLQTQGYIIEPRSRLYRLLPDIDDVE